MPALIVFALALAALFYWLVRVNRAARTIEQFDDDPDEFRRRAALFASPLARVKDPQLAATILMLQLVRTGTPVTAAEKTKIMELMEQPLRVVKIDAMMVRAWRYTEQYRAFSPVADELVPMLRSSLTPKEIEQLVEMLTAVANAYGEASELQLASIRRLRRQCLAPEAAPITPMDQVMR